MSLALNGQEAHMLHSLPALLEELEQNLLHDEDPMPLIGSIRWSEIVDWPKSLDEAGTVKQKVSQISEIISALYSPVRATLMVLGSGSPYKAKGAADLPAVLTSRLEAEV
jgi:hypothetical protein